MPGTIVLAACLLIFAADAVGAQPTGQLAGVVRDTSGGLLPGTTATKTGAADIQWGTQFTIRQ
jgi:hypothetical protein